MPDLVDAAWGAAPSTLLPTAGAGYAQRLDHNDRDADRIDRAVVDAGGPNSWGGHPLFAVLAGQRMPALYRATRYAGAFAAFHDIWRALANELGFLRRRFASQVIGLAYQALGDPDAVVVN